MFFVGIIKTSIGGHGWVPLEEKKTRSYGLVVDLLASFSPDWGGAWGSRQVLGVPVAKK